MEVVTNYELVKKTHRAKKEYRHDKYGRATHLLDKLSRNLENISIYTSYKLLLDIKEYKKKYKLINKGIPKLIVSRFLIVPTYTYGAIVSSEKLIEEHEVFSRKYILSRYKK